jgi:signal transduction histidine kinase
MNDTVALIFSTGNISISLDKLGYSDSSLYYRKKVLELSKKYKYYFSLGLGYLNQADFYFSKKMYDSTIVNMNKALLYKKHLSSIILGNIYKTLTEVNIILNNINTAKYYIDSFAYYTNETNSLYLKKEYYQTKYKIDSATGNLAESLKSLLLMNLYSDSIKTHEYQDKLARYKISYELEEKESKIDKLIKENEIVKLKSRQQLMLVVFMFMFLFSTLIIIRIISKSNKTKKRTIAELNSLNADLKTHKEGLIIINEELAAQREKLYDKNKQLNNIVKQLKQTQSKLLYSEKLASIGILARGAAHEINNPLNFIVGGLHFFKNLKNNNEQLETAYIMISEGVTRIEKIVKGLSTFTQKEESILKKADINGIIENTLQFVNFKIHNNIIVNKTLTVIPVIYCYPDKLHVVFLNIIANAIDATIETEDKKEINISTKYIQDNGGNFIEIIIYNTGEKIGEKNINRIFDPFFTTKASNKGSGLGLTIAYNFIQDHNGEIYVKNKDLGTEFTITIPVNS